MLASLKDARARWSLALLKVPPGPHYRVELGGSKWMVFGSHWLNRMLLCSGDGCPGCVGGAARVMGYRVVLLQEPQRRRPVLLEASCGAIAGLQGLLAGEGREEEPGLTVEVFRRHRRSPLRLEPLVEVPLTTGVPLDDAVTVNAVSVLYGLPLMAPGEPTADWASRVQPVAAAQLGHAIAAHR